MEPNPARGLRFGAFEIDLANSELRKGGTLLKLAPQPFQVLRLLAENGGELCSRDTIRQALWGDGTNVDFDRSLNVCMAQIRAALHDDADAPRFIQTVPRRGYRFVAPVERMPPPPVKPAAPRTRIAAGAPAVALLVLCAGLGWFATGGSSSFSRPLIAALPFEDLSADARSSAFIDGLTEEMIASFGSVARARMGVIARTSVMRFKGTRRGVDQIGRELGSDYLVEGSLRWESTHVHITARLIRVKDQAQVASEGADFDAADAFAAQQQIAERVASAFIKHLFPGTTPTGVAKAHSPAASEAYREGRIEQRSQTRAGLEQSLRTFQKAVALDPDFAEAWASIAEDYISLGRSGGEPQSTFPSATEAAARALRLDDTLAEAHNALANAQFWYDWNWPEAERHFQRALALNPSLAIASHDYAFLLAAMGRAPEALGPFRKALALDPLSARIHVDSGWLLLQVHRYDEAIGKARRSLELAPGMAEAHFCLMRAELAKRDHAAALAELNTTLPSPISGADPKTALQTWFREHIAAQRDPFLAAVWYVFLEDREAALAQLERGLAERRPSMVLLKSEPSFLHLHGEPRFEALVRKMKLP